MNPDNLTSLTELFDTMYKLEEACADYELSHMGTTSFEEVQLQRKKLHDMMDNIRKYGYKDDIGSQWGFEVKRKT
jgi:hypothetical protein